MNVIQRPESKSFTSMMLDYVIDTESTIQFTIKYLGKTILDEIYSPDASFQVRIRKLGKLCALALWGRWIEDDAASKAQDTVAGDFTFLIDGIEDATCYVALSRLQLKSDNKSWDFLSNARKKVTRSGAVEYISGYFTAADKLDVVVYKTDYSQASAFTFFTAPINGIYTIDVSPDKVINASNIVGLSLSSVSKIVLTHGNETYTYLVDQTSYIETHTFRFKNLFDVPETLHTVGEMVLKGANESDEAEMYGINRKFSLKVTDEYTANSGVIFLQTDYRLWHNLMNAQEAQINTDDGWLDIVISKQNFERNFRRNILKAVEFSFKMADPDQNNMI